MTLGYERWANLAPEIVELQSFGHASVSEDGELTIKLMNIDGNVLYEKTITPVTSEPKEMTTDNSTTTDSADKDTLPSSGRYSMMVMSSWCAIIVLFVCDWMSKFYSC